MCDVLHWLPSEQRIADRLAALAFCAAYWAFLPAYLRALCCPVLGAMGS